MDLQPYVDTVRHELSVAAGAGGHDAVALAERLSAPLESTIRLALLDALSTAAEEITRELAPASVDVRLRGREPEFVVTAPMHPTADEPNPTAGQPNPTADDPNPTAGEPNPTADQPNPTADEPNPTTDQPDQPDQPPERDDGGTWRVTLRLPEILRSKVETAARREALSVNAWLVRAVAARVEPAPTPRTYTRHRVTGWVR